MVEWWRSDRGLVEEGWWSGGGMVVEWWRSGGGRDGVVMAAVEW